MCLMSFDVSACGLSDIGLVRQNNEDVWIRLPSVPFFVLADGMGGHQAGEVAAHEAVNGLCLLFKEFLDAQEGHKISSKEIRDTIRHAIEQVNVQIYGMGLDNETLAGMGTTICSLYLYDAHVIYGHVGDSRIYRLRNKKLKMLTKDHSLLRELIDLGQLNEKQASEFLYKNIITKAIGTEAYVEPSIHVGDLRNGDTYLMCTDGLTDLLTKEEIEKIMNQHSSLEECAQKLIDSAKEKGGHDNITVVLVHAQEKQ